MQWKREDETTLLSTPIYAGIEAAIAIAKECPHDTYKIVGDMDPNRSDHPEIKQRMERCTSCVAARVRATGTVEDIQRLWDEFPEADKVPEQV